MFSMRSNPADHSVGRWRNAGGAVAPLTVLLSPLLTVFSATATESVYDSGRVLQHHDNECFGQKPGNCITVVGWDSRQHEHIRLTRLSTPPAGRSDAATAVRDTLKVAATSNASVPGHVTLYAGCSRKPWVGTPFMSSREGVPGNHVGFTGEPR